MPWHGTDAVDSVGRGPAVVPVLVRPVRCDADESFAAAAADVHSSPSSSPAQGKKLRGRRWRGVG
jgi:hypothetical protein